LTARSAADFAVNSAGEHLRVPTAVSFSDVGDLMAAVRQEFDARSLSPDGPVAIRSAEIPTLRQPSY